MSKEAYVVMYTKNGSFINIAAVYTSLNDARYMVKCLNKDPDISAYWLSTKLYSRNSEDEHKCDGCEECSLRS